MNKRILVTGGSGFLGSHIVDAFRNRGYCNVFAPSHSDFDLKKGVDVGWMYHAFRPDIVVHSAAHCGGIGLNKAKPAELFYDNAIMGIQLMHEAFLAGVEKFVQIGTICEYPNIIEVPFREETIWDGYPADVTAPYGLAKKMLLVQGQAYRQQYGFNSIHLMPVNLYGPGDNFSLEDSHVVPALIRKFAEAKAANEPSVAVWGTGEASREFLYVEDAADAIVKATESYSGAEPVNIGCGIETTVEVLASMIASKIGYQGLIVYDSSKPDGQPRRCLSVQKAFREFGFRAKTDLETGLEKTIEWYNKERAVC